MRNWCVRAKAATKRMERNMSKTQARLVGALVVAVLIGGCGKSQAPAQDNSQSASAGGSAQPAAPEPPPPPPPIHIPAGTTLIVVLDQTVSSKTSQAGQQFGGALAAPVVVGDEVAIPKGATVHGAITDAKSAGKFKGAATLTLSLDTIVVRGASHTIHVTPFSQTTKGKGKRTAGMVGGGAAGGALIGGLAGGGKGAAIGAAVGAGAGTAGAAYTGNNRDITITPENSVPFKLAEPLTVAAPGN